MKRAFLLVTVTGVALFAAAPADADPAVGCTAENPGCAAVPGMRDGVEGQPCSTWTLNLNTYGFGPRGVIMACYSYDGGITSKWSDTPNLVGVRDIGSPCSSWQVAQAPDGRPLRCLTAG